MTRDEAGMHLWWAQRDAEMDIWALARDRVFGETRTFTLLPNEITMQIAWVGTGIAVRYINHRYDVQHHVVFEYAASVVEFMKDAVSDLELIIDIFYTNEKGGEA